MNSFRLQNIKAFTDSGEILVKPITILVGKNSCGKSSILRFPAVLAQTAQVSASPISLFGENIDYGNFEDVIYGKQGDEFSFSLSYDIDINPFSKNISRRISKEKTNVVRQKVEIKVEIKRVYKNIKVKSVAIKIEDKPLSTLNWDDGEQKYVLQISSTFEGKNGKLKDVDAKYEFGKEEILFRQFFPIYLTKIKEKIIGDNNLRITNERAEEIGVYELRLLRSIFGEDENLSEEEKIFIELLDSFEYSNSILSRLYDRFINENMKMTSYIGPFRQNPARIYRNSETKKEHVGVKGENVGDVLAAAYQNKDKELFKNISSWLNKYFGYQLEIEELGNNYFQIMLKGENGVKSNIIDVGFGISQVLPIVLEILLMSKNNKPKNIDNILLIEQPELHLHPAAQASLAELFSMCVVSRENARLIIETHSEHLIRKLQVLIADNRNALTNDMVQILYVDRNDEGEAYIKNMEINSEGKFEDVWPTGFFDQGYNLVYELMEKNANNEKE